MVAISHTGENTEKLRQILTEARRCFGLHGFEHTTMNDIAAGVFMSKSSLYYYFPDKESLFKGVIKAELDEFFNQLNKKIEKLPNPEIMLKEFIHIRNEQFKDIINMNIFRIADFHIIKPHIKESFQQFRDQEFEIIRSIIRKGNESGIFACKNPTATADLFIDILQGLRMVVVRHRDFRDLSEEDYKLMEAKHLLFIDLLIKALKYQSKQSADTNKTFKSI